MDKYVDEINRIMNSLRLELPSDLVDDVQTAIRQQIRKAQLEVLGLAEKRIDEMPWIPGYAGHIGQKDTIRAINQLKQGEQTNDKS